MLGPGAGEGRLYLCIRAASAASPPPALGSPARCCSPLRSWGARVVFVELLNIFSWGHSSVSPAPRRGRLHDKKSRKFNTLGGLGHHHGSCQNKQGLAQGCKVLSQGKHCPLPDRESCFAKAVCVLGGRERSSTKPLDHSPHPGSDICSHQPCAERAGGRGGGGRGDSHSHS